MLTDFLLEAPQREPIHRQFVDRHPREAVPVTEYPPLGTSLDMAEVSTGDEWAE
jgi:hypothetical protein